MDKFVLHSEYSLTGDRKAFFPENVVEYFVSWNVRKSK